MSSKKYPNQRPTWRYRAKPDTRNPLFLINAVRLQEMARLNTSKHKGKAKHGGRRRS